MVKSMLYAQMTASSQRIKMMTGRSLRSPKIFSRKAGQAPEAGVSIMTRSHAAVVNPTVKKKLLGKTQFIP